MFAFALYDRDARKLSIARDRLGIKPLFYTVQHDTLVFASELTALMASGLVPASIDPAALDAYLEFLYIPAPDTIYKNVYKLRPGELLTLEHGQIRTRQYWQPNYEADTTWTLDSAAERFRELLDDALGMQCISDVPLGAFLSGGMDSTTVVAALSGIHPNPVKTFTVGFQDEQADELKYAQIAAKRFRTDHIEMVLTPDWLDILPRVIAGFGEPFADSSALPTWLVSKVAREHVTVALSGDGGDELFAGYTWVHRARRIAAMSKLPRAVRQAATAALHAAPSTPRTRQLERMVDQMSRPPRDVFRKRVQCFDDGQRAMLLRPDALRDNRTDRFDEHSADAAGISFDDWMLRQDLRMYLPDDVLTKVDRMSMAHSLEVRVPLLDHRLVEFSATLPFALKLKGATSKRVMKHAMRALIPPALLAQRKRGFSIPIHSWFRGRLNIPFRDLVLSPGARSAAWIDTGIARRLLDDHSNGNENHGHRLWSLLVLEMWLRNTA
jgi:asparagine synthase (glutamine-hydrolysing)